MESKVNRNIELLLGDYRKAIVKLSIPNMIAMFIQTLYNLVDAVWVAGLGPSTLAGMGLFFPIYMIVISIATGIAVGTSSAIARRIGAKDFDGANAVAEHSIILAIFVGFLTALVGILTLEGVLQFTGASGEALQKAKEYGVIIFLSSVFAMFNNAAIGILRGEGDSKRPMYIILFSSVLNMVLDPIFIYVFKWGIKGAAWATNISVFVASAMLLHLLMFSKKTFLNVGFRKFVLTKSIILDIFTVGFPTALAQITMSVAIYFLNFFASKAGGDMGVATFTGAWRIINLGTLTIIGISSAVTTVTGAAYGARDIKKLESALNYAIKFAEYFAIAIMVGIFFFSKPLAMMFAYSKASAQLLDNISQALKILCLFLPGTPFGMLTSGMFQGIGHGYKSLVTTILRTVIFQLFWTWLFVDVFKIGLAGVWLGIVVGNATASIITYTWGKITIKKLYSIQNQQTEMD
ncbi:putative efflux protein, MATE family [Fervidobacterium changbaicum]|uniref:MATE family efflux transporter n=2 Tax=Fervidobacterium TaxID=2422 RepID=A0AAI8GCN4_FERIS|nr:MULTISPECIES: MATE family efflux transporter [Fervidobacterium]AMW32136.1 MATE family efflux transporter [Fervidobacterium islandicum]QAV33908.1 MATE family efflux transporter [Fervidobacterium changbaicum]SDH55478.1 putative efflux protein, MATE family [Fervidobacterium changbaicum]